MTVPDAAQELMQTRKAATDMAERYQERLGNQRASITRLLVLLNTKDPDGAATEIEELNKRLTEAYSILAKVREWADSGRDPNALSAILKGE